MGLHFWLDYTSLLYFLLHHPYSNHTGCFIWEKNKSDGFTAQEKKQITTRFHIEVSKMETLGISTFEHHSEFITIWRVRAQRRSRPTPGK